MYSKPPACHTANVRLSYAENKTPSNQLVAPHGGSSPGAAWVAFRRAADAPAAGESRAFPCVLPIRGYFAIGALGSAGFAGSGAGAAGAGADGVSWVEGTGP